MSAVRISDCRKFSPNIFNKTKCSHCFRQREEHSAAALECNRASREIFKCGYLFVAPDWDFSNPLYRTKRWQRRWFVLYDDGELTYSVDEHPETVPQSCIDMNKVLEVTTAEAITGHTNSIAITAPDRVTFVKGTCPEESKWWLNVLVTFPKSKGRHKRNATFPGAQAAITILQSTIPDASTTTAIRNRHNSYHKDTLTSIQPVGVLIGGGGKSNNNSNTTNDEKKTIKTSTWTTTRLSNNSDSNKVNSNLWQCNEVAALKTSATDDDANVNGNTSAVGDEDDDDEEDDGVETGEDEGGEQGGEEEGTGVECSPQRVLSNAGVRNENNRNVVNEIKSKVSQSPCLLIEDIRRDDKSIKDLANTITNLSQQQKNIWTTAAVNNVLNSQQDNKENVEESSGSDETDFYLPTNHSSQQQSDLPTVVTLRPQLLPLVANSTPAIVSAVVNKIPPVMGPGSNSTNNKIKSSPRLHPQQLKHLQQQQQQQQQQKQQISSNQHQTNRQKKQALERGDPDGGCNLDDLSFNYMAKTVELRVNPPPLTGSAEESLNAKRGWLMKQDNRTGDWTKHWFTLSGAALFYYRDPVSEERGVLDGVLDVNSLTNVVDINSDRSYAFQLITWDKRRLTLASLSPKSRNSWVAVLRNVAGLQTQLSSITTITDTPNTSPINTKHLTATADCCENAPKAQLMIKDNCSDDIKSEIEKDFMKAQRIMQNLAGSTYRKKQQQNNKKESKKLSSDTSPSVIAAHGGSGCSGGKLKSMLISLNSTQTPKTAPHFSSDEEYRTASEGGRRDSVGDWCSPLSPTSPTVPLSILRANGRGRSQTGTTTTCVRLHKRSRSSSPSSRRSTGESAGSNDLLPTSTTQEEPSLNFEKELQVRLNVAEKERNILNDKANECEERMTELLTTLERTEQELNARIREMEEVRESLNTELESARRNASEVIERLTNEVEEGKQKMKDLEDRLARGIEENEMLYKRLREVESCSPTNIMHLHRSKLKRMDSLSDLTQINAIDPYSLERDMLAEEYNELRVRFEKAVYEIRAMKRELKESQNQFDFLEISYMSLKRDLERKEVEDQAQLQMMAARIQDLTLKYSSSERQVRTLKQKLAKSERRRSLSLKGKEQLTVSKELEVKLSELETKISEMEKNSPADAKSPNTDIGRLTGKKSARRRSLESTTAAAGADSLQFLVRVNDLEKRIESVCTTNSRSSSSVPTPISATPITDSSSGSSVAAGNVRLSDHLFDRLRCLENVLVTSKERLEQSLGQLQNLHSSRTRRSVSPNAERKDSYRCVERCLHEVVKLMRESTDTCVVSGSFGNTGPSVLQLPEGSPIKAAVTQLEAQLRSKLAELLKQRRILRERNELTKCKDLELLAERIAFESVCFGKLRDSVERAENRELFTERQIRNEVAETSHLLTMLKAKLSGKCAIKPSGSMDILAGVLARRLLLSTYHVAHSTEQPAASMKPVDQNILNDLLRQQNEINVIVKRYKNNTMGNLASSLAVETLNYISANDMVQGSVQEAWRQAQEAINAELVQSEIAHIMMRNAERLENSVTPWVGYTLTSEERLLFEKFADAVHDVLHTEMELAVTQLTRCYEETMQQMKQGQWRLYLQHERKASEGRQLLSEFADIMAHKALIDARINVLRGEYVCNNNNSQKSERDKESSDQKLGITALQKYEDLFEELSNDLQISHPDDILLEADFEFMLKQHTSSFLNDRQVLSDISTFLSQLEDSLIALQCEATSVDELLARTEISIESLQDVCQKCCELRKRADQLREEVHRKLNSTCQHCQQVGEKLHNQQEQHENDMLRLRQSHAKELSALVQQVEQQKATIRYLEAEKNAISSDLHKNAELMGKRELELKTIRQKLQSKEEELRLKQEDQDRMLQRLEMQRETAHSYREETDALNVKCARQDEEYGVLLQERDYVQAELIQEQERSRRLEKRLEMLELEHSKQMECLQQVYGDQLITHCSDFSNVADEESFRQRYQAEIEQLRTLCEKGLAAMESSHRRIVADLEEKHKQEIERLLIEKETALAEETQATLAALDAMRKAHQSEVQREVARFKQDFFRQFSKGERSADTAKAKEEELEELRQEILSFSEKYSIKCVENAALEEKLRVANQKLKNFQQMQQLELRNKLFRTNLISGEPVNEMNFVQGLTTTTKSDDDGYTLGEDSEV